MSSKNWSKKKSRKFILLLLLARGKKKKKELFLFVCVKLQKKLVNIHKRRVKDNHKNKLQRFLQKTKTREEKDQQEQARKIAEEKREKDKENKRKNFPFFQIKKKGCLSVLSKTLFFLLCWMYVVCLFWGQKNKFPFATLGHT
jgi:hypothetical protein